MRKHTSLAASAMMMTLSLTSTLPSHASQIRDVPHPAAALVSSMADTTCATPYFANIYCTADLH